MRNGFGVTFLCVALGVSVGAGAAQPPPVPDNPRQAQTSLGYSPKKFCPDLRIADEGTNAVVVFWLPSSGIPSRVSVKSSSGSSALDSAAMSCVSKLRFAPATRFGDGEPFDSWQQFALRWVDGSHAGEVSQAAAPVAGAAAPVAEAPARTAADAKQGNAGAQANSVTVHVCVDDAGKLKQDPTVVRSSGKVALDQAAVKIAASGSAYYRPDTSPNGPAVSGCAQLVIQFDAK